MHAQIHSLVPGSSTATLTPQFEEALCRFISQRMGIRVQDHQLDTLRQTVQEACKRFGLKNAESYLQVLQKEQQHVFPELEFLVTNITVGESYFFRDAEHMAFLKDIYLPQLIAQRRAEGRLSLRIWSAGCSQGQEIYSLAIMLHQLLPDIDQWNLHLLGTDINTDSLSQAIRGSYTEWSLRASSGEIRAHYFRPNAKEYQLLSKLRKQVKFACLNLIEDSFPAVINETNQLDLILCRNVFIYLNKIAIHGVMKRFRACLDHDGVLLVGASDLVDHAATGFAQHNNEGVYYFRPQAQADNTCECDVTAKPATCKTNANLSVPNKAAAPDTSNRSVVPAPACDYGKIIELLQSQNWGDALEEIDRSLSQEGDSAILLQHKARALANLGELATAEQLCKQSIALDLTAKHAYLTLALVLMELDKQKEAEGVLRNVIYLDHLFVEAHYHLAMLCLRNGRTSVGLKHLKTALEIAEQGEPSWKIHNAPDISYERFAEIIRKEIVMYSGPVPDVPS